MCLHLDMSEDEMVNKHQRLQDEMLAVNERLERSAKVGASKDAKIKGELLDESEWLGHACFSRLS